MAITDLTPRYDYTSARDKVVPNKEPDEMAQKIGGLTADAQQLSNGGIQIQGVAERILIGAASAPMVGTGIFIGNDGENLKGYDFRVGDPTGNYLHWDASAATLTISGVLTASALNIPNPTTVNSFHVDSSGNSWWGTDRATGYATAPASILNTGYATFANVAITGGVVYTTVLDKGLMPFTTTIVFSATDNDTVAWTSGAIKMQDGTTYTIDAGNTGNMTALTYIYLDTAVSLTVLQTTTTYSTAVGDGKIMLCTAQNHATGNASFIPYGGQQAVVNGDQIAALSIVAGNIAAGAVSADKMSVSSLSAINADLGSITAGSISINGGVASISTNGDATFKSIRVGGSNRQYSLTDNGIFSFGDGSDGDVTISSPTTLTSDKYYQNLTINAGQTLNPNGYRIFVQDTLTVNGHISGDGNNGGNGERGHNGGEGGVSLGDGGVGGAALPDGYLRGSSAGATGGQGGHPTSATSGSVPAVVGGNGVSKTNSLGFNASNSGNGGRGRDGIGGYKPFGSLGTSGTVSGSNCKLIANWHLATLLDISSTGSTVKYDNSASAGAGGGGGEGNDGTFWVGGGGGGGAGSSGRILAIYAKKIVIGATGSITANGGSGGNGGNGGNKGAGNYGGGGGGGAGAGGNGGIVILVYNYLSNSGTISASAGTKGTPGNGGNDGGEPGATANDGSSGVIYQFNISL